MESRKLAPVYLDNEPVGLQGDPKPMVSKIIAASGQSSEGVEIRRLLNQADPQGKPCAPNDVIDRTATTTTPIYLKSVAKQGSDTKNKSVGVQFVRPTAFDSKAEAPIADATEPVRNAFGKVPMDAPKWPTASKTTLPQGDTAGKKANLSSAKKPETNKEPVEADASWEEPSDKEDSDADET